MAKPRNTFKKVKWLFGKEIEIPVGWKISKFHSKIHMEYGSSLTEGQRDNHGKPVYGSGGVIGFHSKPIVQGPALLIARKGSLGNTFYETNHFFPIDTVYYITKNETEFNLRFLFYYIKNMKLENYAIITSKPGISRSEIYSLSVLFPPLSEQIKIASILSGVDALIESTQKVIEKTERLKKGLMQKLLTRGISHMEFKKVKWLFGKEIEIPEEWNIKKFKNMAKINPKKINKEYPNQNILYVNIGSIDRFQIVDYDVFTLANRPSRAQRIIERNDVIVSTVRPYLKAFSKVKKDNPNMVCSTGFTVLRTKNKEDGELIFQFIQSKLFEMHMMREMEGLAYPAVTSKVVANSLIPYPIEKDERQKIASNLSGIDVYIQKNQEYKKKMELLKKGLMQKLLTGQIRVKVDH